MGTGWFQRYGVPGTSFVIFTAAWVHALYGIPDEAPKEVAALVAATVVVSLPIGYIISIFTQLYYLKLRSFVWMKGIHQKAKIDSRIKFKKLGFENEPEDEPTTEAYASLLLLRMNPVLLPVQEFMRNWISRRMDIIAINQSLVAVVFLSCGTAHGMPLFHRQCLDVDHLSPDATCLLILSLIILVVLLSSIKVLSNQIVIVVSGVFRHYDSANQGGGGSESEASVANGPGENSLGRNRGTGGS